MTDLTYVEEPRIALAPGAFGGLVITADTTQGGYADHTEAVAVVRGRLEEWVHVVDWDRATVTEERRGRRRRYTLFVPPLAVDSTDGERAPAEADPLGSARHLDILCTDAEADVAMREGTQQRLDMALGDLNETTPPALRIELSSAFESLDRWSTLPAFARRGLYDESRRLVERIFTSTTTPTDPPVERVAS